jgi:hypothetical protein
MMTDIVAAAPAISLSLFGFDLRIVAGAVARGNFRPPLRCRVMLRPFTLLLAALPAAALAAELPPQAPPPPGAVGAATLEGLVRGFSLGPQGAVTGLLLDDGTEVHVSHAIAMKLVQDVKPGDSVHVQGWRTVTPGVVTATAVTDARTGGALVDPAAPAPPRMSGQGEQPRPLGLPPPGAAETTLKGRVLRPLHAADGRTDGALLGDGMQLRLPPDAAGPVARLLQPGEYVAVQGYAMHTPYGQVMSVQAIGGSTETLTPVAPGPAPPPVAPAAPAPSKPPGAGG